MAMPAALARWHRENRKGHSPKAKTRTRTVTKYKTRTVHVKAKRHNRRHGKHGGAVPLIPVMALAAGLGYASDNMSGFVDTMKKVPGVKTFGAPLVIGGIAYGINRFVYANRWLRLIAAVGLTVGAFRWGQKEFSTEWLGDVGDVDGSIADIE